MNEIRVANDISVILYFLIADMKLFKWKNFLRNGVIIFDISKIKGNWNVSVNEKILMITLRHSLNVIIMRIFVWDVGESSLLSNHPLTNSLQMIDVLILVIIEFLITISIQNLVWIELWPNYNYYMNDKI